jgi:dienelactone hydrolase
MLAETIAFRGHSGDVGEAYYARPLGAGPFPGVVLIHHMPGWDKALGKNYEFHRYDGAGHAFFNAARPAFRPEQALDGWDKVFAFFRKHLARPAAARAA